MLGVSEAQLIGLDWRGGGGGDGRNPVDQDQTELPPRQELTSLGCWKDQRPWLEAGSHAGSRK